MHVDNISLVCKSIMIAQWENECSSLSVLPVARVMIAQWDNESISLSIFFMARVHFLATVEYFKQFFPGLSHSASQVWQKMAPSLLSGTAQPVDSEEEGQSSTTDR